MSVLEAITNERTLSYTQLIGATGIIAVVLDALTVATTELIDCALTILRAGLTERTKTDNNG